MFFYHYNKYLIIYYHVVLYIKKISNMESIYYLDMVKIVKYEH